MDTTRLLGERRTTSAGDTTALDFYLRHYAEVFRPLLELMAAGFVLIAPNVPDVMMNLLGEYLNLRHKLLEREQTSSHRQNRQRRHQPKKLGTYLYETLGLPKQFVKDKRRAKKGNNE